MGTPRAHSRRCACLDHEALDVAVEDGAIVVAAGTQRHEVGGCPGHLVAAHLNLQLSQVAVQRDRLQRAGGARRRSVKTFAVQELNLHPVFYIQQTKE